MKASAIIILAISGFFNLTVATDLTGFVAGSCISTSAFKTCHKIAPGKCCSVFRGGPGAGSGMATNKPKADLAQAFQTIPESDAAHASQANPACGVVEASGGVGKTHACLELGRRGTIAGLKYVKQSSKRARGAANAEECETVLPDTLGLADGRTFNLTSMTLDEGDQLWALAATGATIDSIPKKYLEHRIL